MPPPRLTTLTASAVLATALLLSVTACSKSSHSAGKSSAAPSSSAASGAGAVTQNTLPAATSIVNDTDKRKAITVAKCAASDGGWTASGTAKNAGTADATYNLTIFFTNEHATVEDFATASVTVKPGATGDWTATKKFTATTPTNCVLRGVG